MMYLHTSYQTYVSEFDRAIFIAQTLAFCGILSSCYDMCKTAKIPDLSSSWLH